MLTFLEVQQFALIDKVRIGFAPGFNVFTGETGAGKSILIDALGIVLGGRAPSDAVRTGADAYQIQAVQKMVPYFYAAAFPHREKARPLSMIRKFL